MTDPDDFFIGWSNRLPAGLRGFVSVAAVAILGGVLALSATLARSGTDPGNALFGTDAAFEPNREVALTGILTSDPTPLLMLPADAAHPQGHGVLMTGEGKHGVVYDRGTLEGRLVEIKGTLTKRGSLDMVVVSDGPKLVAGAAPASDPAPAEKLGRWRIVGEICDGKCAAGAMGPGTGLAHKACATLCLFGQVPPVLVSTAPLQGHRFMLIADQHGRALGDRLRDFIAMRVSLEGEVERRGDVLVLRTDLSRAHRL